MTPLPGSLPVVENRLDNGCCCMFFASCVEKRVSELPAHDRSERKEEVEF